FGCKVLKRVNVQLTADGALRIFFFFQAEDGIRDKLVTGVQTCALPICTWSRFAAGHCAHSGQHCARQRSKRRRYSRCTQALMRRSEERRVGKECRARWAP